MNLIDIVHDFIGTKFTSLMLLMILLTFSVINRKYPLRVSAFNIVFILLILLVVLDYSELLLAGRTNCSIEGIPIETVIRLHQIVSALSYVIEPLVLLCQLWVIAPSRGFKTLCVVPSVLNTIVYLPAAFGARYAFYVDMNNIFNRAGVAGLTIYLVLMFYVLMLCVFSIMYFKSKNANHGYLLMLIAVLAIVDAYEEGMNLMTGHATEIMIASALSYYLYLTAIYQYEIREEVASKKLFIAQQEMTILREQIQPHFIFNSLSIIRSLIRLDSKAAVRAIDSFSDYLQAHFRALRHDNIIFFEQELHNVKAYLDLVEADYTRKIKIIYHLEETQFRLPTLCLEPLVENAIMHGTGGEDGIIIISTRREDGSYLIEVSDNGTGGKDMTDKAKQRVGVGIENTRKRLELLCSGTLEMEQSETGTTVRITIPDAERRKQNEDSDC